MCFPTLIHRNAIKCKDRLYYWFVCVMMMGQVIFVLLRKNCYCIDDTVATAPGHVFFSGHIILLFLLGHPHWWIRFFVDEKSMPASIYVGRRGEGFCYRNGQHFIFVMPYRWVFLYKRKWEDEIIVSVAIKQKYIIKNIYFCYK